MATCTKEQPGAHGLAVLFSRVELSDPALPMEFRPLGLREVGTPCGFTRPDGGRGRSQPGKSPIMVGVSLTSPTCVAFETGTETEPETGKRDTALRIPVTARLSQNNGTYLISPPLFLYSGRRMETEP